MASHHFADGQIHPGHSRARCPSAANEHARNAPADPAQPAHTTPRHPQPRRMDLCRLPRLRQHRPPATRVGTKPSHRPGLGVRKPLQTLPRQTRRATRDTLTPRFWIGNSFPAPLGLRERNDLPGNIVSCGTRSRSSRSRRRPIFWLSKHLGHSSLNVTSNVYGHFEKATRRREAQAMAGAFGI